MPRLPTNHELGFSNRNPYAASLAFSPLNNYAGAFPPSLLSPRFASGLFGKSGRPKKRPLESDTQSGFRGRTIGLQALPRLEGNLSNQIIILGSFTSVDSVLQGSASKYHRNAFNNESSAFPSSRTVDLTRMSDQMSVRPSQNQLVYKCDICEKSFQKLILICFYWSFSNKKIHFPTQKTSN